MGGQERSSKCKERKADARGRERGARPAGDAAWEWRDFEGLLLQQLSQAVSVVSELETKRYAEWTAFTGCRSWRFEPTVT